MKNQVPQNTRTAGQTPSGLVHQARFPRFCPGDYGLRMPAKYILGMIGAAGPSQIASPREGLTMVKPLRGC
ncbi:MAG: hypothetical protein RH980_16595 [Roseovarius confluentis]|jgi:hypothetical protein